MVEGQEGEDQEEVVCENAFVIIALQNELVLQGIVDRFRWF